MFIVQNRETGLYYRNSRSNGKRYGRSEWVADITQVLPIRTLNAVKQLFKSTGHIQYEFNRRKWTKDPTLPECCKQLGYHSGKVINQCEHYKAAITTYHEEVRRKYRVFRVELTTCEEQEL
jgi:hypothetical protein